MPCPPVEDRLNPAPPHVQFPARRRVIASRDLRRTPTDNSSYYEACPWSPRPCIPRDRSPMKHVIARHVSVIFIK